MTPPTLAGALRAGLGARWLPDRLAERIRFANEAVELARHAGDRERVLEAVSWQLFDLMELGQVQKLKALLADYTREADELRQPFYQYIGLSSRSMLALFEGRFEEAEQWADRALAFGARMPSLDAAGIHGMQMFSIRREQGRLKELAAVVAHLVRTTPEAATWRPGLAVIYSELGMREQARTEFEAVAADDFAGVPRDGLWASCMTFLPTYARSSATPNARPASMRFSRLSTDATSSRDRTSHVPARSRVISACLRRPCSAGRTRCGISRMRST